jgi:hypothetical protein
VACDDQFNPNLSTACGDQAVTDHAIGISGESGFGADYGSVAVAHGIPIMPMSGNAVVEVTNPLAFPTGNTTVSIASQLQALKALGAHTIALMAIDVPEIVTTVTALQSFASHIGVHLVAIFTPPTATDFTAYVAQAISDGANGMVTIEASVAEAAIYKDLRAEGKTSNQVRVAGASITLNPAGLAQLGSAVTNGMIITSDAWNPAAKSTKPFYAQYFADLKAAGYPRSAADTNSLDGWATLMMVATALHLAHLSPTPAHVAQALVARNLSSTAESFGLTGEDFRHNAFAGFPAWSSLRYFTNSSYFYQDENGKIVALSQKPLSVLTPVKF